MGQSVAKLQEALRLKTPVKQVDDGSPMVTMDVGYRPPRVVGLS